MLAAQQRRRRVLLAVGAGVLGVLAAACRPTWARPPLTGPPAAATRLPAVEEDLSVDARRALARVAAAIRRADAAANATRYSVACLGQRTVGIMQQGQARVSAATSVAAQAVVGTACRAGRRAGTLASYTASGSLELSSGVARSVGAIGRAAHEVYSNRAVAARQHVLHSVDRGREWALAAADGVEQRRDLQEAEEALRLRREEAQRSLQALCSALAEDMARLPGRTAASVSHVAKAASQLPAQTAAGIQHGCNAIADNAACLGKAVVESSGFTAGAATTLAEVAWSNAVIAGARALEALAGRLAPPPAEEPAKGPPPGHRWSWSLSLSQALVW